MVAVPANESPRLHCRQRGTVPVMQSRPSVTPPVAPRSGCRPRSALSVQRRGFWPRSVASRHTFAHPATGSPPPPTAPNLPLNSRCGIRSPNRPFLPEHSSACCMLRPKKLHTKKLDNTARAPERSAPADLCSCRNDTQHEAPHHGKWIRTTFPSSLTGRPIHDLAGSHRHVGDGPTAPWHKQ